MREVMSPAMHSSPSQNRLTIWTIVPFIVIGACLTSNFVWDLRDQKVWDWDPSAYAWSSLLLWNTTSLGLLSWLDAMAHALGGTPPLMVWLGQFFIPLRHLTGDVDPALLSVNLLTAGATLVLVCCTALRS